MNFTADLSKVSAPSFPRSGDIDVVIPVCNGARFIRECIESVFAQTLRPRRIIIVDDGSIDGTADIVDELWGSNPSLLLHRMERNLGVSAARNAGIRLSEAPFIAFIDADDIWRREKLARQAEVFEKCQRPVGFVHSSFFLIDETGNPIPHKDGPPPLLCGNIFLRLLREGNILSGSASSILIKRGVLDRAGFFDEQLYYGEDWDLWLRLAAISEAGHTSDAVVGIRIHPKSAQVVRGNGTDRFLQLMMVYCRWEQCVREDRSSIMRLRRAGFIAFLTSARSFREVVSFYPALKTSKQSLVHDLYGSQLDFWSGLLVTAIAKVIRLIDRSLRRCLRSFGWIN